MKDYQKISHEVRRLRLCSSFLLLKILIYCFCQFMFLYIKAKNKNHSQSFSCLTREGAAIKGTCGADEGLRALLKGPQELK